jgi:hypothetical protein
MQNYITENNVDILVMVTHKRHFLERIFNPCITRRMSYHLEMGFTPYALKMGFKEMYYTLGGKIPHWGLAISEIVGDHTFI